jgi:hypothetical protein
VSPDPLAVHAAGKADFNLYAYVSGAVLKSVDPVGLEVYVEASSTADSSGKYMGMDAERQKSTVLGIMQRLTNDKLELRTDEKGVSSVVIKETSKNGNKPVGTALVRDVIQKEGKRVTISLEDVSGSSDTRPANAAMAVNGKGSDSRIRLDLGDINHRDNVLDSRTGQTKLAPTSATVGLGHELIHAKNHLEGAFVPKESTKEGCDAHPEHCYEHTYKDVNGELRTQTLPTEEANTVGFTGHGGPTENGIRSEQGEEMKVAY